MRKAERLNLALSAVASTSCSDYPSHPVLPCSLATAYRATFMISEVAGA